MNSWITACFSVMHRALPAAGVDLGRFARSVTALPRFVHQYRVFCGLSARDGSPVPKLMDLFPVLADATDPSGIARGHYFHQDLWAARQIYTTNPKEHYDIGSRIDGFISALLVFRRVTVIDLRPLDVTINNLTFVQADATNLSFLANRSVESISSLHAMEHFGLGRYGDSLAPGGWRRGVSELVRVCANGGRVYFSAPLGRERVMFNAHRVFAPRSILESFDELELLKFSAVDDEGEFVESASPEDFSNADYACGLFVFGRGYQNLATPEEGAAEDDSVGENEH